MEGKEKFSIKKRIASFGYAFGGLWLLLRNEHNAWIHCAATVVAIVGGIILGFSTCEWIAVCIVIGMVFAAELFNTAIECLCNLVCPSRNESIRKVKDLSAAAVLVCATAAVAVAAIILISRF